VCSTKPGREVDLSLRTALAELPDDRATAHAAREIIAYFAIHVGEPLLAARIGRSTGLEEDRVFPVLAALAKAGVIDCDGDPTLKPCTFEPDVVHGLEVDRYLRSGGSDAARLQSSLGKFRSRLGRS
jgi:hypothetical protein